MTSARLGSHRRRRRPPPRTSRGRRAATGAAGARRGRVAEPVARALPAAVVPASARSMVDAERRVLGVDGAGARSPSLGAARTGRTAARRTIMCCHSGTGRCSATIDLGVAADLGQPVAELLGVAHRRRQRDDAGRPRAGG